MKNPEIKTRIILFLLVSVNLIRESVIWILGDHDKVSTFAIEKCRKNIADSK